MTEEVEATKEDEAFMQDEPPKNGSVKDDRGNHGDYRVTVTDEKILAAWRIPQSVQPVLNPADFLPYNHLMSREAARATAKFGRFRSPHEGHSIIREELEELFDAIRSGDIEHAAEEALQIGAMALLFAFEFGAKDLKERATKEK